MYLVRLGGFDTHSNQVQAQGDLQGKHYNLLDELSTAIEAFMRDVNSDNIGEDIVGITISEFGRKAQENGSLGTDHGEVAPVFVFGKPVESGISGVNVDFSEATQSNNFQIQTVQYDYRQTLATLMQDFLGAGIDNVNATFIDNTTNDSFAEQKIQNLLKSNYVVPESCWNESLGIENSIKKNWFVYPNPFKTYIDLKSLTAYNDQSTSYILVNQFGQIVQEGTLKFINESARIHLTNVNTGLYILTLNTHGKNESYKLLRAAD